MDRISGWVTATRNKVDLGTVPAHKYVARAHVHVTEEFNSDGADALTIGYTTDPDAFVTSIDVSSTGVKAATLGALAGYNSSAHSVEAIYTAGGSAPTTGKVYVCLELWGTPPQPS